MAPFLKGHPCTTFIGPTIITMNSLPFCGRQKS